MERSGKRRVVASNHAILRFMQHSAKLDRCYTTGDEATGDLLSRVSRSRHAGPGELRNDDLRRRKYEDSIYLIEPASGVKTPFVFVVSHNEDFLGRPVTVVVTCYPFKGSGASRAKPKNRDTRAQRKMAVRRLLDRLEDEES